MKFDILLLVGAGGAAGSMLRYAFACWMTGCVRIPSFFGTFVVNVVGSLAIGFIYGLSERHGWFSPQLNRLLTTGLCGGFTTFSAFAYENLCLVRDGQWGTATLYATSSIIVCLAATFSGTVIAQ
ncbi:MAG: fluoride efflux transporter CrcB [Bacteroidales bacterium]|jgi:CrcB protein|nr:fluoride efflux transporter CrcB [Bacteroidales bacterium]